MLEKGSISAGLPLPVALIFDARVARVDLEIGADGEREAVGREQGPRRHRQQVPGPEVSRCYPLPYRQGQLCRTHLMTDPHADETSRLRSLGWPAADVSHFQNLKEYKHRWGAANLEREERLFLKKAEVALRQAGLSPIRREASSSSRLPVFSSSDSYVALDFETANSSRDSACSLAIIRVEALQIVSRTYRLIRPPSTHFMFTDIHGITWNDVRSEPTFKELWREFRPLFDGVSFIAAHNASVDSSVMKACCNTYGLVPPGAPYLCTVKLARQTWQLKPANLPSVCSYLGLRLQHHNALSDAEACANIVRAAAGCKVK